MKNTKEPTEVNRGYSLIKEINEKIKNSSSGYEKNLFLPIGFYNINNVNTKTLPSYYGKVETLDIDGNIEIQVFNNSWFSRDYDKKVIAWRYINNNL